MARTWKCRACKMSWPRTKQVCKCGRRRPTYQPPAHRKVLEVPYEKWAEAFGEVCGICGAEPSPTRGLDRDHDHRTGLARGLLCHRCNRGIPNWAGPKWMRKAAA